MPQCDFFSVLLSKWRAGQKKYPDSDFKQKRHLCWWLFKRLFKRTHTYVPVPSKQIHILFYLNGGIGDIVLALNFLKQFKKYIQSDNVINICVPAYLSDTVQQLCFSQTFIGHIYTPCTEGHQYDIVVHFVRVPFLAYVNDKKVSQDVFLTKWADTVKKFNRAFPECMLAGTTGDFLCETYTRICGRNRVSQGDIDSLLHITDDLILYPHENTDLVLQKYGLTGRSFITVQRGTGPADGKNELSTRLWDLDKYHRLCHDLKQRWPDTVIVQVGDKTCSEIKNTDMNLCGKTALSELLVLLKTAKYHIDGECGMVHLRHFLSAKPSVVLFGPTREDFYAYPENMNVSSDICSGCEWVHDNWRNRCLKSGDKPVCLQKILPQDVIQKIREYEYVKNKAVPISAC